MSRLQTETLAIGLCADAISLVAWRRGWRGRRALRRTLLPVAAGNAGQGDWRPALQALDAWLGEGNASYRGAAVVLSDRFVRYALIPASDAANQQEDTALGAACFETCHGDMHGWVLAPDAAGGAHAARIACALPAEMREGLRALLARHRLPCRSLRPAFVAAWNRWRRIFLRQSDQRSDWLFASAESGGLVIASARAGGWHSVRSMACPAAGPTLTATLTREALLNGLDPTLHTGLAASGLDAPSPAGSALVWLGQANANSADMLADLA